MTEEQKSKDAEPTGRITAIGSGTIGGVFFPDHQSVTIDVGADYGLNPVRQPPLAAIPKLSGGGRFPIPGRKRNAV